LLLCLIEFFVFFYSHFIILSELSVDILDEISVTIDDIFILLERLLKLLTSLTIIIIIAISTKVERFLLLSDEFYEILQIFGELFEVIASLFLRIVELLEDQVFDEGVDVRFAEERISETRLVF
jgi:hypothetical protein